jgi:hypothetical protein
MSVIDANYNDANHNSRYDNCCPRNGDAHSHVARRFSTVTTCTAHPHTESPLHTDL